MPKHYVRFQPVGARLLGHTSEASAHTLPRGYVFAYENLAEVFGDWSPFKSVCDLNAVEVVTFTGRGEYDPGDAEGVAVRPIRIVRVESPLHWLRRLIATTRDSDIRAAAREALDDQEP